MNYLDNLVRRQILSEPNARRVAFWVEPMIDSLVDECAGRDKPLLVAVAGAPASGKSIAMYHTQERLRERGVSMVSLSLDNFQLSLHDREVLANRVHPLFATRGVHGTHDLGLLRSILGQLTDPDRTEPVALPVFEGRFDAPALKANWPLVKEMPQIIAVTGWCLGSVALAPSDLVVPQNAFEAREDPLGQFRRAVNLAIREDYSAIDELFDRWVVTQAPSFEAVLNWMEAQTRDKRNQQGIGGDVLTSEGVQRFLGLIERNVRELLKTLPDKADYLFTLDQNHKITSYVRSHRI